MSVTDWVIWFGAQGLVLIVILGIAMLGATGRLKRDPRATSPGRSCRRRHRHFSFRHHAAH